MRISKFNNHALLQIISPIVQEYISKQAPDKIISAPDKIESRACDLLLSAGKIIECIDQLYFTVEMLSGFKRKKKGNMNRHDHIVYMIENFYLRITSIFDRALRLSNLVFQIGLPEKECRESTIIMNQKIKGTEVERILQKLNRFTSDYRLKRNQIAHQEGFHDKELSPLEMFYYLLETDESAEFQKYRHLYKTKADNYVLEKKNEFNETIGEVEDIIDKFFNTLIPFINLERCE